MTGISDSGSLQFWQGIAAVFGAAVGGFFLAVGRRAGVAARQGSEAATSGDALQREILAELRGLRAEGQARREADDERWRDIRFHGLDEQIDDMRRELRLRRLGQDDIKTIIADVRDRLPPADSPPQRPDPRRPAAEGS